MAISAFGWPMQDAEARAARLVRISLIVFLFLFSASFATSWMMDGDAVYWRSAQGSEIRAWPAIEPNLMTHTQLINFSYNETDPIYANISFVFDTPLSQGSAEVLLNRTRETRETELYRQNFNITISGVSGYSPANFSLCDIGDLENTFHYLVNASNQTSLKVCFNSYQNIDQTFFLNYSRYQIRIITRTTTEPTWVPITSNFTMGYYLDKSVYTINDIPFQKGQKYQTRFTFTNGQDDGKYDIYFHRGSPEEVIENRSNIILMLDPWWNSSYIYSKNITIQNNGGSNLTSYELPIQVYLNASNTNGTDMRWVWWNGTTAQLIPFCRLDNYWNYSNASGVIWVNVPSIPNESILSNLTIYYNGTGASDGSNCASTFPIFFEGTPRSNNFTKNDYPTNTFIGNTTDGVRIYDNITSGLTGYWVAMNFTSQNKRTIYGFRMNGSLRMPTSTTGLRLGWGDASSGPLSSLQMYANIDESLNTTHLNYITTSSYVQSQTVSNDSQWNILTLNMETNKVSSRLNMSSWVENTGQVPTTSNYSVMVNTIAYNSMHPEIELDFAAVASPFSITAPNYSISREFYSEPINSSFIYGCGIYNTSGYFYLNQSINSTGTCLTINTTNFTLNCAGFSITGGNGTLTYGVYDINKANLTIRNCIIKTFDYGIYISGLGAGSFLFVNNTINVSTTTARGIDINAPYSQIENNTINSSYLGAFIHNADFTSIVGNRIMANGGGTSNGVIYTYNQYRTTIANNTLVGAGSISGIFLHGDAGVGTNTTLIENNTILSLGGGRGINAVGNGFGNLTIDCKGASITGSNGSSSGIVSNQSNLTIKNCVISNHLSGIIMTRGDALIKNNSISTTNANGRGIDLSAVFNSSIVKNSVNATSMSSFYALNSANLTVENNTLNTSAIGLKASIALLNISSSSFTNNTLSALSAQAIITNQSSSSLIFSRNSMTSLIWVNDSNSSTSNSYNVSNAGNAYYFVNGSGAWSLFFLTCSVSYPCYADGGSSRPFNSTTVGSYWPQFGQDWFPYTNSSNQIPVIQSLYVFNNISLFTPNQLLVGAIIANDSETSNLTLNYYYMKNGANFSINKSCTNSSTETNNCANATNILGDDLNWTITEPSGVPFNATLNFTSSALNFSNTFDLKLNAGYFYSGGPHYVELGIWDGSTWVPLFNLSNNVFTYNITSLNATKYSSNGSVLLRLNHPNNGVSSHTGIVVDYAAISVYTNTTIRNNTLTLFNATVPIFVAGDNYSIVANVSDGTNTTSPKYSLNATVKSFTTSKSYQDPEFDLSAYPHIIVSDLNSSIISTNASLTMNGISQTVVKSTNASASIFTVSFMPASITSNSTQNASWSINYSTSDGYTYNFTTTYSFTLNPSGFFLCNSSISQLAALWSFFDIANLSAINATLNAQITFNRSDGSTKISTISQTNYSTHACIAPSWLNVSGSILETDSAIGYSSSTFISTQNLSNSTTFFTRLMLNTASSNYYTFTVQNQYGAIIQGATVNAYRLINSTQTLVQSATTDSTGSVVFPLQTLSIYTINVSASGYQPLNYIFAAGATTTIILRLDSANPYPITLPSYSYLWDDVSYSIQPSVSILNSSTIINFTVSSASSKLSYWGMRITRVVNGTQTIVSTQNSTTAAGGTLSYTANQNGTYLINTWFKHQNYSEYDPLTRQLTLAIGQRKGLLAVQDAFSSGILSGWAYYLIAVIIALMAVGWVSQFTIDGAGLAGLAVLWGFTILNPADQIVCVAGFDAACITTTIATTLTTVMVLAALYLKNQYAS